jgi:hypothetical protein
MRDVTAVMVTVDRTPNKNYLMETLANLRGSGMSTSTRLKWFILVDSGPGNKWAKAGIRMLPHKCCYVEGTDERRCANMNVAAALRAGARSRAKWVLFLEDDIDVCDNFFDSVGAWLDDHERPTRMVYPLGAAYPQVDACQKDGRTSWEYPIGKFYGTQAVALRAEHADDCARYLEEHCYDRESDGTAYDLLISDWARDRWPNINYFLTPTPSMVQHIGRSSVIRPREHTHVFGSWPGRSWSYTRKAVAS